jgi:nucleotide-binding universal stress UspA family protein
MFQTIVCGVHKAESARAAARAAHELARQFHASLHLVGAFTGRADPAPDAGSHEGVSRRDMEAFLDQVASSWPHPVVTHALPGSPASAILRVAEEVRADLIVVGNKGMRGVHRVLGSVPNSIAHRAACAVLIVNTTGESAP